MEDDHAALFDIGPSGVGEGVLGNQYRDGKHEDSRDVQRFLGCVQGFDVMLAALLQPGAALDPISEAFGLVGGHRSSLTRKGGVMGVRGIPVRPEPSHATGLLAGP